MLSIAAAAAVRVGIPNHVSGVIREAEITQPGAKIRGASCIGMLAPVSNATHALAVGGRRCKD